MKGWVDWVDGVHMSANVTERYMLSRDVGCRYHTLTCYQYSLISCHTSGKVLVCSAFSKYDLWRTHLPAAMHDRNFSFLVGEPSSSNTWEESAQGCIAQPAAAGGREGMGRKGEQKAPDRQTDRDGQMDMPEWVQTSPQENAKCDVVMKLSVFGTRRDTHKAKPIHPRYVGCN